MHHKHTLTTYKQKWNEIEDSIEKKYKTNQTDHNMNERDDQIISAKFIIYLFHFISKT